MGISRSEAEKYGLGHLYPKRGGAKGVRGPAHTRFVMNRTESRYAETLEARRLLGEIRKWEFETATFVLGPEMTFTPDFEVEHNDGTREYVDVKGGHTFEDSLIKAKAAAVMYPWHRFTQAQWKGGDWKVREFKARG